MSSETSTLTIGVIELVYFAGCPNVEAARTVLRRALERKGLAPVWREWDQTKPGVPARVLGLGSPTILVNGRDITGGDVSMTGPACRFDSLPGPELIIAAIAAVRKA